MWSVAASNVVIDEEVEEEDVGDGEVIAVIENLALCVRKGGRPATAVDDDRVVALPSEASGAMRTRRSTVNRLDPPPISS